MKYNKVIIMLFQCVPQEGNTTRTFALIITTEYFLLISLLNDFENFSLHNSQVLPTALLDVGVRVHHHAAEHLDGAFELSKHITISY